MERLIEEAEEKWADLRQPVILAQLHPAGSRRTSRGAVVEGVRLRGPTPLVMDYPVVVRSIERLQRAARHRPWHHKWRQLRERPADSHSHWSSPEDEAYFFHLERELKEDRHAVRPASVSPPVTTRAPAAARSSPARRPGCPR